MAFPEKHQSKYCVFQTNSPLTYTGQDDTLPLHHLLWYLCIFGTNPNLRQCEARTCAYISTDGARVPAWEQATKVSNVRISVWVSTSKPAQQSRRKIH